MPNLTLVQPNRVTNARYDFTALQKNIIYYIYEALQYHLTKEKQVNKDLFSNFIVSVPVTALAGKKNNAKVIDAAKDLMTKPFQYDYERDSKKYTVATVLVHTAKHEHGTNTVELTVPFEALSLLLYIGEGFTVFQKTIAISLKLKYSKRLYELCCRWKDKGGFNMDLTELKQMLCIEKQYSMVSMLKKFVLDSAKKELKESADVWFEYELRKVKSRSFNWIYFTIFANDLKDKNAEKGIYPNVYNYLLVTFPNTFSDKAVKITDQLSDKQKLSAAWGKFRPLYEKYQQNKIETKHLMNLTKKILREDFQINTD
jgi:plasmid replication initiation protein